MAPTIPTHFARRLACATALALAAGACGGGGDSFSETDEPQLTVDQSTPQRLNLQLPRKPEEAASQQPIRLRNSGEADLEITKLEWVARPDRLIGATEYTGETCEYDVDAQNYDASGTCSDDSFCWFQTDECRQRGLPQTPVVVKPNAQAVIEAVLLPGTTVDCPEPPSGRDVPANYCGELLIETNAINDSDIVSEGKVRFFFTHVEGSGEINVSPGSLTFSGIGPGQTASRDLTISNTSADTELEIDQINFQESGELFQVSGAEMPPTTIPTNGAKTFTVTFQPPAEWTPETFGTNLEISSSAAAEPELIPVSVTPEVDLPAVKIEPNVLRFDENAEQTLTLTNEGAANFVMQSFSIQPSTAGSFYAFTADGNDFTSQVPSSVKVVQPGESQEITVKFAQPAGSTESPIATLEISYNYFVDGDTINDTAEATLLGDAGDSAVGMLAPDIFTFRAASGNTQTRFFAIRNVGTQDLEITGADFNASLGSLDEFSVDITGTLTVPAGGIEEVELTYTATDDETDNGSLDLTSNTAGQDLSVFLVADQGAQASDVTAVITPGFGDGQITVGTEAAFSALQSTGVSATDIEGASWALLARPDGSTAYVSGQGADASFFPDVAGTYKISVLVSDGSVQSQETYTFEAVAGQ